MAGEMEETFNIETALTTGLVPVVCSAISPRKTLAAYVGLYLEQEVKAEALVRDVGSFARFLEAISFSHGAVLNITSVARECQVNRNTVQTYIEVLEDLLLAFRIPVFSRRARRHLISHPKFFFFDAGIFKSLRPNGPLDSPEEMNGPALEGLVAQHLRAWMAYGDLDKTKLFFWRTKSGNEVDFVIYGPGNFFAVEVKNSRNVYRKDVKSLRAFKDDYPEANVVLLYRGDERLLVDDVLCLPCSTFLQNLIPGHPLVV
mgnify:CR=1 FL=1